jgi:hypothetical protein
MRTASDLQCIAYLRFPSRVLGPNETPPPHLLVCYRRPTRDQAQVPRERALKANLLTLAPFRRPTYRVSKGEISRQDETVGAPFDMSSALPSPPSHGPPHRSSSTIWPPVSRSWRTSRSMSALLLRWFSIPLPSQTRRSKWPGLPGADRPGTHRAHKRSRTGRPLGS